MAQADVIVVTHGGAGSRNEFADGTERAGRAGWNVIRRGISALDAACLAVTELEDDGRFNAGIGSRARADGSVQMDAACMDSAGRFGAVGVIEGFRNPVKIAHAVCSTPQRFLAGRGAEAFAREGGFAPLPADFSGGRGDSGQDTVGCVAFDGQTFAVALSTGGTGGSPPGRVGDVPLIGCGLYAGSAGALCATGHGESIAMNITAFRAYQLLEKGLAPPDVLRQALGWFDASRDFGLILVSRKGFAGGSNRSMAWSACNRP
jgi:isoaspartyl peptidase/L-asparaginase-like protein (Ntn-hydrolase superfamily)